MRPLIPLTSEQDNIVRINGVEFEKAAFVYKMGQLKDLLPQLDQRSLQKYTARYFDRPVERIAERYRRKHM